MRYTLSVVMPALNEEANIAGALKNTIQAFERLGIQAQIVVVNDGSTDGTCKEVEKLQQVYPFIKLLPHASPLGIGRSFWDGAISSEGEVVVMLPGDGENDAHEILQYLPLMEHVDMVVPFVFNGQQRSVIRRIVSRFYRFIINLSFGTSLNYTNGTVLYRRAVFEGLRLSSNGFFYQTELLMKAIHRGFLYAEVPYALKIREHGDSKAISMRSFLRVVGDYLRTIKEVHFAVDGGRDISLQSVSARRRQPFHASPRFTTSES